MPSILFVCTANICRSPLAMAIYKSKISNQSGWKIESAGTWAAEGLPAASNTQIVAKEYGIDLTNHLSRQVTLEILSQFDLIITLEKNHKEALKNEFKQLNAHIFFLSEIIGGSFDIKDPMGGSIEEFYETAREIDHILTEGWQKLMELLPD
jgi:protein-tyrosine-phosphatase